ncbi:MAG TPA: hypothetical protein VGF58_15925 [Burkholderiales bacterium]|jgi:hypothetical protein
MKSLLVFILVALSACSERPTVGVTISNTPEPIESCGKKIGPC